MISFQMYPRQAVRPSGAGNGTCFVCSRSRCAVVAHQAIMERRREVPRAGRADPSRCCPNGRRFQRLPDRNGGTLLCPRRNGCAARGFAKANQRSSPMLGKSVAGCEVTIRWSDADYLGMKVDTPLADAYERNARALQQHRRLSRPSRGRRLDRQCRRPRPDLHPLIACAFSVMYAKFNVREICAIAIGRCCRYLDGAKAIAMTAWTSFVMMSYGATSERPSSTGEAGP